MREHLTRVICGQFAWLLRSLHVANSVSGVTMHRSVPRLRDRDWMGRAGNCTSSGWSLSTSLVTPPYSRPATLTDFISIYRFFHLKIWQNTDFFLKFWQNTDFLEECERVLRYSFFNHSDFYPKIQNFLVIYTDFVSDRSSRSAIGYLAMHCP